LLADEGYAVEGAASGEEGLRAARDESPDIILCDVRMQSMDGLEFLDAYRDEGGEALVIVMTAYGSIELAVQAMKRGAYDYLPKPFDANEVLLALRKAEEREQLTEEVSRLRREVGVERRYGDVVIRSAAMRDTVEKAERVARYPTTVLITGESGTGKEVIARLIHRLSPRRDGPFIAVNCGAIPENLLESELFGHARGAFTGATRDRPGMFEEADGGTLLLDEIGELPEVLQVKLLRTLQEGEIRRVGESRSRRVDARIMAATAQDLEDRVRSGVFRQELFYRINVVRIHVAPLRQRREAIPPLVRHFVERYNRTLGTRIAGFTPPAMERMLEREWVGNVRELENVVERAMVLTDGTEIGLEELDRALPEGPAVRRDGVATLPADELSVKKHTADLERRLIARALEITGGNRTRASELLDLSYRALRYKIKDYDLQT
ncbi:MAG TPA: sigma-54 dependent transcriptional regulator, partial [Gemmatimonadota bacterium]|nr:sigma-54 dependent transcriptional regulator [Gemmatimonadota bacterium]